LPFNEKAQTASPVALRWIELPPVTIDIVPGLSLLVARHALISEDARS